MQNNGISLPLKLQSGGGVYGRVLRAIIFVIIQGVVLLGVISLYLLILHDSLTILSGQEAPLNEVGEYHLRIFTSVLYSAFEIFDGIQDYSIRIGASIALVASLGLVNASMHEKFFHREKYNLVLVKGSVAIASLGAIKLTHFVDQLAQIVTTMWATRNWDDDYWHDYLEVAQKYVDDVGLDFDVGRFCGSFKNDHVPLALVLLGYYKTALTVLLVIGPLIFWILDTAPK